MNYEYKKVSVAELVNFHEEIVSMGSKSKPKYSTNDVNDNNIQRKRNDKGSISDTINSMFELKRPTKSLYSTLDKSNNKKDSSVFYEDNVTYNPKIRHSSERKVHSKSFKSARNDDKDIFKRQYSLQNKEKLKNYKGENDYKEAELTEELVEKFGEKLRKKRFEEGTDKAKSYGTDKHPREREKSSNLMKPEKKVPVKYSDNKTRKYKTTTNSKPSADIKINLNSKVTSSDNPNKNEFFETKNYLLLGNGNNKTSAVPENQDIRQRNPSFVLERVEASEELDLTPSPTVTSPPIDKICNKYIPVTGKKLQDFHKSDIDVSVCNTDSNLSKSGNFVTHVTNLEETELEFTSTEKVEPSSKFYVKLDKINNGNECTAICSQNYELVEESHINELSNYIINNTDHAPANLRNPDSANLVQGGNTSNLFMKQEIKASNVVHGNCPEKIRKKQRNAPPSLSVGSSSIPVPPEDSFSSKYFAGDVKDGDLPVHVQTELECQQSEEYDDIDFENLIINAREEELTEEIASMENLIKTADERIDNLKNQSKLNSKKLPKESATDDPILDDTFGDIDVINLRNLEQLEDIEFGVIDDSEEELILVEAYNDDGRELVIATVQISRRSIPLDKDSTLNLNELLKSTDSDVVLYKEETGDNLTVHTPSSDVLQNNHEESVNSARSTIYSSQENLCSSLEDVSYKYTDDEGVVTDNSLPRKYSSAKQETIFDEKGNARIKKYLKYDAEEEIKIIPESDETASLERADKDDNNNKIKHGSMDIIDVVEETGKIKFIIEELKNTERKYVDGLKIIVVDYKPYLDKVHKPHLMGKSCYLFGNIADIYIRAAMFCEELELQNNVHGVASVFVKYGSMFKLYPEYLKNKPNCDKYIKDFQLPALEVQNKLKDRLGLSSYLLTPLQRLGKYILMLQNLQKELQKQHNVSSLDLHKAIAIVKREMVKGNDILAIDSIQKCPLDSFIFGSFLMRNNFIILKPKPKSEATVFLFENVVVFTATDMKNMESFIYQDHIDMNNLRIISDANEPNKFQLQDFQKITGKKKKKTYELEAKTIKMRDAWVGAVENILWKQLMKQKDYVTEQYKNFDIATYTAKPNSEYNKNRKATSKFYTDPFSDDQVLASQIGRLNML